MRRFVFLVVTFGVAFISAPTEAQANAQVEAAFEFTNVYLNLSNLMTGGVFGVLGELGEPLFLALENVGVAADTVYDHAISCNLQFNDNGNITAAVNNAVILLPTVEQTFVGNVLDLVVDPEPIRAIIADLTQETVYLEAAAAEASISSPCDAETIATLRDQQIQFDAAIGQALAPYPQLIQSFRFRQFQGWYCLT